MFLAGEVDYQYWKRTNVVNIKRIDNFERKVHATLLNTFVAFGE